MKFAVDRIINNICVIENIDNGEILELDIKFLPNNVREGNILIYDGSIYKLDTCTEMERKNSFRARLNKLKNKRN